MALALNNAPGVPELATALVMALIAFAELIGGIERIARVTEVVVPFGTVSSPAPRSWAGATTASAAWSSWWAPG